MTAILGNPTIGKTSNSDVGSYHRGPRFPSVHNAYCSLKFSLGKTKINLDIGGSDDLSLCEILLELVINVFAHNVAAFRNIGVAQGF